MKELKGIMIWNVYFYVMAALWDSKFEFNDYFIDTLIDNMDIIPILALITVIYVGIQTIYKELKPVIDKLSTKKQDKVNSEEKAGA